MSAIKVWIGALRGMPHWGGPVMNSLIHSLLEKTPLKNLEHKHVHHLPLCVSSLPPLLSLNSAARYYHHCLKSTLNSLALLLFQWTSCLTTSSLLHWVGQSGEEHIGRMSVIPLKACPLTHSVPFKLHFLSPVIPSLCYTPTACLSP